MNTNKIKHVAAIALAGAFLYWLYEPTITIEDNHSGYNNETGDLLANPAFYKRAFKFPTDNCNTFNTPSDEWESCIHATESRDAQLNIDDLQWSAFDIYINRAELIISRSGELLATIDHPYWKLGSSGNPYSDSMHQEFGILISEFTKRDISDPLWSKSYMGKLYRPPEHKLLAYSPVQKKKIAHAIDLSKKIADLRHQHLDFAEQMTNGSNSRNRITLHFFTRFVVTYNKL